MVQKYTIWKLIIQNLNKHNFPNKGFTLLELIFGMLIMIIVSGLALNAFIQASTSFNKDKKDIDSNQKLSAVLELIGNDIRQAGEGINDNNFPAIEFSLDPANTTASTANTANPQASSRITIRKAIQSQPLTLCQEIPANVATLPTQINIAQSDTTVTTDPNCTFTPQPPPLPSVSSILPVSPTLPSSWRTALNTRQYRCQLDTPDSNYLTTATDLCATTRPTPISSDKEQLRAAVSNGNGRIRVFNYYNDNFLSFSNVYYVTVGNTDGGVSTLSNDVRNRAVTYPIGSPIYLIEERVYALDNNGNLTLTINGNRTETLIKKMSQFNVSAKLYTNSQDQVINPNPTSFACPNPPATPSITNPTYVCQFNYNTVPADLAVNWKTLAGVRIALQAKYDGNGQSATPTTTDSAKLSATAEYFPRNVLSR